jgi:transcriptional regulator with XRE-family HTH domain/Zn-dependent peptidase ImmA (M78 family)
MRKQGLSQAEIASRLEVSRQAVTRWIRGSAFPRPRKLLEMSRILDLAFRQLVVEDPGTRPVVAFRKHGRSILTDEHVNRAAGMGYMLRNLVKYLQFDTLSKPSSLISPRLEFDYVVEVAAEVRKRMHLVSDEVDFTDLIQFFDNLHAVLIPVLWGKKKRHENAIHIYLPDSQTTWIFLNLDTQVVDFKFWMAHELGHVKAPDLDPDDAEEFADAFAAELLFPHELAKREYDVISRLGNTGAIINEVKRCAFEYMVSPATVYKQINSVAQRSGKRDLGINIYPAAGGFAQEFRTVSQTLFGTDTPTASNYVRIASHVFKTKAFDVLGQYLRDKHKGSGFIQKTLSIPVIDAKQLYKALVSHAE